MFDIEENLQKGDISLRTGQNIESTSFRRLSNFYKLPGLETNKVYLFDINDPYSPINSIQEGNNILFGYIYFYDQNRIFLREYAPLKYIQDYFPILFRCPEGAVYIRFTVSVDTLKNILNTPYGLEKEKQIKSEVIPISQLEKNNWEGLPKNLYLSMFYAQQEDLENESLWDITLSSNSFAKEQYILYDKFVGDNLALSCKSKAEKEPTDYTIIDNFKITNFNTLVLRRMGEAKYYIWFLTRKVAVNYSVTNGTFIGEPIKILNPSLDPLKELPLSRTGTFSSVGGNVIIDDLFPKTRYILENNAYLRLQKIDEEELLNIELKVEEGVLYATTYPVPSTVTVKDQYGNTSTYPITQLDPNLFNQIDLTDVSSFKLDTLDLSKSNITTIGENCCRDIGLNRIFFMNGSSSFKDLTINSKAFYQNNLSTLSFPDHLKGTIDKEAFAGNPLKYIFFNCMDSSNVFITYENIFNPLTSIKGVIICPNLEQYSKLNYGQSYDPQNYFVITGEYHYIIKNSSMEKTYQDTNGLYLYMVSNEEQNEVVVLQNPSSTSYGEVSFVRYLFYYNEEDLENTKIYYLSGIQEKGFSNSSIQSVTLGFSSGEEFYVGSSAFEGCLSLTRVLLNQNVSFEGEAHFKNCDALESFPMQSLKGKIPAKMFQNCENLNINGLSFLQEGIIEIGDSAFENHRLEYLSIPSTVSKIGSRAFATDNYSFSMVLFEANTLPDLPDSPGISTAIQDFLFQKDSFENNNGTLTMITVSSDMMEYVSYLISILNLPYVVKVGSSLNVQKTEDGYIHSTAPYEIFIEDPLNNSSVLFDGFQRSTSGLTKFTLSDLISVVDPTTGAILELKRVSGITKTSFNTYNTGITEITFNIFMETLEDEVFKGNKTIKSLTFGEQFKKIGDDALNNSSIETINLNSKNVTIGVRGLYQCGYFTGDPSFWSCISTVEVLGCASSGVMSLDGLRATAKLHSFSFYHCLSLQTLPDPINFSVGSQAFDSCEQLKSCLWRNIEDNFDKSLDSNCLVFDFGPFVTFFGSQMGDLEEVQKTLGTSVTIHNSGYIFNKCFQINDYRIVNIPFELFVTGIFCTESIDNSNAWIRFEIDYDTFRNNDYIIPDSNVKRIYELLMDDLDYSFHSSCFFPEYYYIANSTKDPTDEDHLIDIDTISPSSEKLCHFLKMRARVEIIYYGSLNGTAIPIIAVQNKTSPTFYGRSIADGVFYQFPWYIPHAIRITEGAFAGYRVSLVGSPKDVPGHDKSSSYVSYLLGPAYDRSTRKTKDWIMPSSIFVSSNFRNIDLLAFCYKDEHRPDLIMDESDCENMLGNIIKSDGKVYNTSWGDEWKNEYTYNYAVHLPAKGLEYFGKSNCWENGPGGGWIHYVGGGGFNNTLIYPTSLKGRTESMPGSLSSKDPSIARLFAHSGYCFKAIIFPKGMTDFYNYTISMRDSDDYPVKTFYFHEDQVRAYDGSFHDTKNNSDTTIYCLSQNVADSVKNGADKGKWKAYVGTEQYQFDIRIILSTNEERPEKVTHHQIYRDQLLLPYEEFMRRKDEENLSSELPLSTIMETRPLSVLAYGQQMDFSIQLNILKGTQEAVVTGFLPEYPKTNMRAYPFARYVRIENNGKQTLGCDIPITVWEENCCQTDVLEILHLPFTTKILKTGAFFTPNLKHMLLNAGLESIQSRSILTKAPPVNNKRYTISVDGQTIVGEEESGFKLFYIPRTIHDVALDSIVEILGTTPQEIIQENPKALRKVVESTSHYLELETTREKSMTNFYVGSEYYTLSDIKSRYSGSFIDSLPEDLIVDENFCEYKIKTTEEGDPYAVMVSWRPEEYMRCLDTIPEEDRERFVQEEFDRLFPDGRIVIPQYLIDTNDEDTVNYYPIGAISSGCFQNIKGIKSIRFPGSVFYYGSDLIKNSSDLQSIEICCLHPEHLTVKDGAFLQNGFATITVYTPQHTHEQIHGGSIDIDNKFKKETCNIYRLKILDSSDPRGLPIKPYSEE